MFDLYATAPARRLPTPETSYYADPGPALRDRSLKQLEATARAAIALGLRNAPAVLELLYRAYSDREDGAAAYEVIHRLFAPAGP